MACGSAQNTTAILEWSLHLVSDAASGPTPYPQSSSSTSAMQWPVGSTKLVGLFRT
jgi:hypothetical protein